MKPISPDARRLALRAGLMLVRDNPPCHGYGNGCTCPECADRATLVAEHKAAGRNPYTADGLLRPRPAKPQPWQTKEAA